MYTSAFLGVGSRARKHAEAYRKVTKGRPVAACNRSGGEPLESFLSDFGVGRGYRDAREMLEKEKPDLLHIVTGPKLRVPLMTLASEYEVPVVIVEKPIAVQGEDWKQLRALADSTSTKFVVNTQLHFHPPNMTLKRDVAEDRIGTLRFVDVSARSTILDQGVHVLELAHSYMNYPEPVSVFASASGTKTIETRQPSPDTAEAVIEFENGVRTVMTTGSFAPTSNPSERIYHHKRVCAYGDEGFVHWTMVGWERFTKDGGYEKGAHDYFEQDELGQAALTDAAFELLDDPAKIHPTCLDRSLTQFNIILGAYISVIERSPVRLPCDPPDGLLDSLQSVLPAESGWK